MLSFIKSRLKPEKSLLITQALVLLITTYFFWFPSVFPAASRPDSIDRADYIWLLGVYALLVILRTPFTGRLWTQTPLDLWLVVFIILGLINVEVAPYGTRGWMMLARPLLGMAIYTTFVELARTFQRPDIPLKIVVVMGIVLGSVAMVATQWNSKAEFFQGIIVHLPRADLWFAPGGFNANEIAGAIVWLIPLMIVLTLYPWKQWRRGWQITAGIALSLLVAALILGQSRSALIGTMGAMIIVAWLGIPRGRKRVLAIVLVGVFAVLQLGVMFNLLPSARNTETGTMSLGTFNQRLHIWQAGIDMTVDHPLTGVGMDRFRYGPVREDYPIVVNNRALLMPHAHNAFIQVGADLGIPGLMIFMAWAIIAGYMLWTIWLRNDERQKLIVIGVACGLLAHGIYSLGDAITLWDRFSFMLWFMLGMIGYYYIYKKSSAT